MTLNVHHFVNERRMSDSLDDDNIDIEAAPAEETSPTENAEEPEPAASESEAPDDAKDAATRSLFTQIQACVSNMMASYCSISAKGSRIIVVAERVIPKGTEVFMPGTEVIQLPRSVAEKIMDNMNSNIKEAGEDVNFATWFLRTFNYATGSTDLVGLPVAGMHALDMASYVRRAPRSAESNVLFKKPRVCVATRDVAVGEEIVALASAEECEYDRARMQLIASERGKYTGKAARKAKLKARKKAAKDAKKKAKKKAAK